MAIQIVFIKTANRPKNVDFGQPHEIHLTFLKCEFGNFFESNAVAGFWLLLACSTKKKMNMFVSSCFFVSLFAGLKYDRCFEICSVHFGYMNAIRGLKHIRLHSIRRPLDLFCNRKKLLSLLHVP